jgi:predicted O-methyltransferase YrrM
MKAQTLGMKEDGFVAEHYKKAGWASGTISYNDAHFLYDLMSHARPKHMMEIGVASGVSTAFISRALSNLDATSSLHAFDASDRFYANRDYECGAFLKESFGQIPHNVSLVPNVPSINIFEYAKRSNIDSFDLAFIDANHLHPWPCLDLLSILPLLKPNSWVALHDINLPYIHAKHQTFGPYNLYNIWPGDRLEATLRGDWKVPNIGAIKLLDSPKDNVEAILRCLALPWQIDVPQAALNRTASTVEAYCTGYGEVLKKVQSPRPVPRTFASTVTLANMNPWSRLNGAPWSDTFVLHANPSTKGTMRLVLSNIETTGRFLVFPSIENASEASGVTIGFAVNGADDKPQHRYDISLTSGRRGFQVIDLSDSSAERGIEVSISTTSPKVAGAWAKFEPMYAI